MSTSKDQTDSVHPMIVSAVRQALSMEDVAVVEGARPALHLSHELVSACVDFGLPIATLAEAVGSPVGVLRDRLAEVTGQLSDRQIRLLTGMSARSLYESAGQRFVTQAGNSGPDRLFATRDVLWAITHLPVRTDDKGADFGPDALRPRQRHR